jgi:hypothetical protein
MDWLCSKMPGDFYDDDGNHLKECIQCKEVLPIDHFYKYTPSQKPKGYKPRCRTCYRANVREINAKRAKKRRQKTNKLSKIHVDWIREQKGKLSTRETARQFSERFFNMKINNSTVSRIFNNKIHVVPDGEDTMSIYGLLEGASEYSGSVEDYIESTDDKKIKF